MINILVSESESVIFIADISVIGISVYLLIGAPLLTGTYACLQALVNNALTWQSSCVIANNTKTICPRLLSCHCN